VIQLELSNTNTVSDKFRVIRSEVVIGDQSAKAIQKILALTRLWFLVTRPMFLMGSFVLAFLGTSVAWWDGFFSFHIAVLAFIGLLLWHISVNMLNEYFDYRSGIDYYTVKTPFHGGSGILPAQLLKAGSVLRFSLLCFVLAVPIWIYLVISKGWELLPIVAVGAICVLLYTPVLTKWRLAEVSSAVGMGVLPILAFYFVQTGDFSMKALAAAISTGILLFGFHLLAELPDAKADMVGGRKTLPVILGIRKAVWLYVAGITLAYISIVIWVVVGNMPQWALLGVVTLPVALFAMRHTVVFGLKGEMRLSLWINAIVYIFTLILLALGYIVDGL